MSGNEWEDNSGDSGQSGPKALREHLEKIQAQLKEAQDKNAALEATNRANAISNVLTSKGFNPKIAALVPTTVEASEEKLNAWLDENAELFPKSENPPPPNAAQPTSVASEGQGDVVDRIGTAVAMGLPPDALRNLEAEIAAAKDPADLERILGTSKGVRFN